MRDVRTEPISSGSRLYAGWAWLDRAATARAACWLAPFLCGLVSMALGQDVNWDLSNYHLYNAYALLNGRIGFDLAPAQFQSYFNPTLDLLYYGLIHALPPQGAAFVMGLLHGFNFVLLLALARRLLPQTASGGYRLPLLLALAGCLGTAFLSQLGNTMGDDMTSLCVLGALLWLLRQWPQLAQGRARGLLIALGAGVVMGLGTGLKLTNANYALALCLALLTLPAGLWLRLRTAFVFGVGVLAGIAAAAGYWYWTMWSVFGNPLFPQFNNIFKAPLAAPIGVADTGWLPQGWLEAVLWPFIFTLNPRRVIELPMTQIIWPLLYVAFIALALRAGLGRFAGAGRKPDARAPLAPGGQAVLVFFALSYLMWLKLFAIYRYLVPLELLAPLVFWLLLQRLARPSLARPLGAGALLLSAVVVFPMATWGHAHYGASAFKVEAPRFSAPEKTTVLTVFGDPPLGWMVPYFPRELAFVSLGSGFPESSAYGERVLAMLDQRGGQVYMMVSAYGLEPGQHVDSVPPTKVDADNSRLLVMGQDVLRRYGLQLQGGGCRTYSAYAGDQHRPYQLCVVRRRG
ncbi:MAG: hypothetical protein V4724_26205 [Pseudomonadota bacterium]